MARVITDEIPIVVDTREQLPYDFPGATRGTLRTGDYSIRGYEDRVAVERKSFDDLIGCVGRGRKRFREQIRRLGELDHGAIVIEASMSRILAGHDLSKINPAAVVNTLISWSIRFGVQVWCVEDRTQARATTYRILEHWLREHGTHSDPKSCRRCNRTLTDQESARRGVGPVCRVREMGDGEVDTDEVVL